MLDPELLEKLLRECASRTPDPWVPKESPMLREHDWEELKPNVERLWIDGYIDRLVAEEEGVFLFAVSSKGERLLDSPRALERYKEALSGEENNLALQRQRETIKSVFENPITPHVVRILLVANLLVFGYGLYLAKQRNVPFKEYLLAKGNLPVMEILDDLGMLERGDVVREQWWRLLSTCFVHGGILHILMNMIGLVMIGRDAERMWGHGRFLLIYLIAGVGGSCFGIYKAPAVVGASGALCGILAAVAVWLICNRRVLPKRMVSGNLLRLLMSGLLIALLSLMPRVSGWGHLGGALVGAVAAFLLHYQRFAAMMAVRVATGVVALMLPIFCVLGLQHYTKDTKAHKTEAEKIDQEGTREIDEKVESLRRRLRQLYREHLDDTGLLVKSARRRDEGEVARAKRALAVQLTSTRQLIAELESMERFQTESAEKRRTATIRKVKEWRDLLGKIHQALEEKKEMDRGFDTEAELRFGN